jgi:hypothetical protein
LLSIRLCKYAQEAKQVILDGFKEALQRDPQQKRQWVVVIDALKSFPVA